MKKILIQLDTDPFASSFDRVVAMDAGADELFAYAGVPAEANVVSGLVHGALFTRAPQQLQHTAFFVGGSRVELAETVFDLVQKTYFGPFRCSVMLDPNGANTTAAAAVLCARRHLTEPAIQALVLGGTGPVGQRVALLLARQGATVWLASRSLERAEAVCTTIRQKVPTAQLQPVVAAEPAAVADFATPVELLVAAGAAGTRLADLAQLPHQPHLRVAIDLNAVEPTGLVGLQVTDAGREVEQRILYGALGVGKLKMKIHKAGITRLFEVNNAVLEETALYAIGEAIEAKPD